MAAIAARMNIEAPNPLKPRVSMATPPIVVLSMADRLMAALFRLIMVPLLWGTCSRASVAIVVMVMPAMAVPIAEVRMASGTGSGAVK